MSELEMVVRVVVLAVGVPVLIILMAHWGDN